MEDDIYSMVHCLIETLFFFFWLKLSFLDLKTLTKLIIFQKKSRHNRKFGNISR